MSLCNYVVKKHVVSLIEQYRADSQFSTLSNPYCFTTTFKNFVDPSACI